MTSSYVLVSRWEIACSRAELWDALEALLETPDPMVWWPSVTVNDYRDGELALQAASGLGYTVRFRLMHLQTRRPDSMTFTADGDLRGRGEVAFVDQGPAASVMEIDWRVVADRPWMRWTGWVLRPVFVAGHHLVMRRGERHLNAWLAGRGPRPR
ncbi:MAG: hypothetical protein JWP31_2424 [Aeromicrobium sp.]|nr:hypothetical protein [Aeromicrobium sp.]